MPVKQKILVVDDEGINRSTLSNLLEDTYEIVLAKNGVQALKRISSDSSIDLILLDVMMPEMDGYEVLKAMKDNEQIANIPVVFITSKNSTKDEEIGLRLGAVDYISKPFNPTIVKLRLDNHLRSVRQRKLLEVMVGVDGLTEIANRRRFDETLSREWLQSRRTGAPLSLAMIDVDFFKAFNDNHGHAEGDIALKVVANTISKTVKRPGDLVARYGGEEFVLLLPDTDREGAKLITERVRLSIEQREINHGFSSASKHLTVSIGGATMVSTGMPEDTIVKRADQCLYRAKDLGRNQVVWED